MESKEIQVQVVNIPAETEPKAKRAKLSIEALEARVAPTNLGRTAGWGC